MRVIAEMYYTRASEPVKRNPCDRPVRLDHPEVAHSERLRMRIGELSRMCPTPYTSRPAGDMASVTVAARNGAAQPINTF